MENPIVLEKSSLDELLDSYKSSAIEANKPDLSKVATMEDIQKILEASKPVEEKEEVAEHERIGILDQAMGFDIAGIQVGKAALGGFSAIFTSELVDGFMISQSANIRGLTKIGVGWGLVAFASKWLGKSFTGAAALFLTFDALRDLSPMNEWAAQLADRITGQSPAAGLRGNEMNVVSQAQGVADYYSRAEGR